MRSATPSSGTSIRTTEVSSRSRGSSASASASACATVRGKPSSTIDLSSRPSSSSQMSATIRSSGTRPPRSMYSDACSPSSVPCKRASRRRSPVESVSQPSSRRCSACVPLSLPSGPSSTMVLAVAGILRLRAQDLARRRQLLGVEQLVEPALAARDVERRARLLERGERRLRVGGALERVGGRGVAGARQQLEQLLAEVGDPLVLLRVVGDRLLQQLRVVLPAA